MNSTRFTWLRAVVIALYAMAASALGLGHKPALVSATLGWAGFVAHDATLLCLSHDSGDKPSSLASHCDACLLTSAPGLAPATASSFTIAFLSSECRYPFAEAACSARFVDCGNRARAPPMRA